MDISAVNFMSSIHVYYDSWVAYINQWLMYAGAGSPALASIIALLSLWVVSGVAWWCCLGMSSNYHYYY